MSTPIISFVGKSESGKTTLLGKVIAGLKQRGYKVAVIKHTQEFELDREGTSSWRLRQAGADAVVLSSPEEIGLMKKISGDMVPRELVRFLDGSYDLVLTEGYKTAGTMKIEVHRKDQGSGLLSEPGHLLAVVTDEPLETDVPQFSRDDAAGLIDIIETWLLKQRREDDAELFINGQFVPLNEFVKSIIFKTTAGMVSSLKGINEVKELRLTLRRRA